MNEDKIVMVVKQCLHFDDHTVTTNKSARHIF